MPISAGQEISPAWLVVAAVSWYPQAFAVVEVATVNGTVVPLVSQPVLQSGMLLRPPTNRAAELLVTEAVTLPLLTTT